jgi:hypothetical protein
MPLSGRRHNDPHLPMSGWVGYLRLRYLGVMKLVSADGGEQRRAVEQANAAYRRRSAPDNEVPGAVAFNALLARNADLAVALVGGAVFSNGISLSLAVRLRHADETTDGLGSEVFRNHRRGHSGPALLIGVEYPDGQTASNVSQDAPLEHSATERPSLSQRGGGGGGRSYEMSYWLTPLPPPGDLTIVVAWPSRGLPEARTVLPSEVLAQASANVTVLWPWTDATEEAEPRQPTRPDLPAGGWFAQHNPDASPAE